MTITESPDKTTRSHRVRGGAGTEIYVHETGEPTARPVLFIHGFSQCRLAWDRQLHSDLERDLRLVAMDLRGHGRSGQPHDMYGDPSLWADDVDAVITGLGLEQPILCGWSYGGVVVGDYIRRYGEQAIGGVNLVGAVSRLGESAMPFLGPEFVATLPGMFANDVEVSASAIETFVRLSVATELAPDDLYRFIGYNSIVAPHVRQAMMSRTIDDDDVFARLTTPTLISHGLADRIVLPTMSDHLARVMSNAVMSTYPGVGHTPFWEDALRFNSELVAFASSL
jgi:non-heme chloroperoxidase